ncbi:MAG: hypothetical protein EXQ52_10440 [Bryobacterales bacterium]|nr:hypothetical protein [Bryobacterales bacterium]
MRFVMSLVVLLAAAATAASRSAWEGACPKEHASQGETAYDSTCAWRHGEALLGDESSPALVDQGFLEKWNGRAVGTLVELTRKTILPDGPGRARCRDSASVEVLPAEHRTPAAAAHEAAVGADHRYRFEHQRSRLDDLERRRAGRGKDHPAMNNIDLKNARKPERSPLLVRNEMTLPASVTGVPMTYLIGDRQYIVVASGAIL